MSKETVIRDDLTNEVGALTRKFSIGPRTWEIDLTDQSFAQLEKAVARYTKVAREVTPTKQGSYEGVDQGAVRSWAQENGYDILSKGRVPLSIVEAYRKAQEPAVPEPDPA